MATYNVSTWDEFITAFAATTGTEADPDVIEIMTDIDVNTNPPTSQIRAGSPKIVNGNYHTIWNLAPGGILGNTIITPNGNKTITVNKVNFNNIAFLENFSVFAGNSSYPMVFNDCTFVAKVASSLFAHAQLNRCAVTMTGSTNSHTPMSGVTANYSWIHYEHRRLNNNASIEFAALNTCYIEGKITTTMTSASYAIQMASNPNSCVFNVDIDNILPCSISTGTASVAVSVYNTDKITNYTGTRTEIIGVTDSQLKDAAYLAGVGFDIVT